MIRMFWLKMDELEDSDYIDQNSDSSIFHQKQNSN